MARPGSSKSSLFSSSKQCDGYVNKRNAFIGIRPLSHRPFFGNSFRDIPWVARFLESFSRLFPDFAILGRDSGDISETFSRLLRMNSEELPNFKFWAKIVFFWGKIIKMITRMNFWILTNSPYTCFYLIFHFKTRKSYIESIRLNHVMHTSYNFCDFVSKKGEFKLKTKVFKFLGI